MNKKALVLSSGGVDSTTCVSVAVEEFGKENVSTVSIFYGQKHRKELECARKVAEYYGLSHYELDLSKIFQYSNCSLLDHSTEEIVHESYEQQIAENGEGKVSTYVPFRNGLMLSAVASLAMSIYEKDDVSIFIGAHALAIHGIQDRPLRTMRRGTPMRTAVKPSSEPWGRPFPWALTTSAILWPPLPAAARPAWLNGGWSSILPMN